MPDAIPTDATATATAVEVKDLNDPNVRLTRTQAMEAVKARRRETVLEDMTPAEQKAFKEGTPVESEDEETALEVDPTKQVTQQTRMLTAEELGNYRVKVKVNGEEREETFDNVLRSAQKNEAADRHLADATREAKRILDEAVAKAAAIAQTQQAAPKTEPPTPATTVDVKALLKEGVGKLFAGDEDAAVEALASAFSSIRPQVADNTPKVDMQQIARQVKQELTVEGALRQFSEKFADIMDDPERARIADEQLLIATGHRDLRTLSTPEVDAALERAGKATRDWFGLPTPKSATVSATTREEKVTRKEKIDELPATSTRAASTVAAPRTTADVIAQMQKARGQGLRDPTQRP